MTHALIAKEAFQYKNDRIKAAMNGDVLTMDFLQFLGLEPLTSQLMITVTTAIGTITS
jgi:hypothetical protein